MQKANLLLLLAVLLPPKSLNRLGAFVEERTVQTPYGDVGPLALRVQGDGPAVWVQPYMGLPTRTDPRATIYAAKALGVKRILNWDMGIGINPVLQHGQPLIAVDYIDWTRHQPTTFFTPFLGEADSGQNDSGQIDTIQSVDTTAARIAYNTQANPNYAGFCPEMSRLLQQALPVAPTVTYAGVDGPRRETPAEARMFRSLGVDVLGQNLVPEVTLANELGVHYAGLVTMGNYSADQRRQSEPDRINVRVERTMDALKYFLQISP